MRHRTAPWSVEVLVPAGAGPCELVADHLWQLGATAVAEDGESLVAGFPDQSNAVRAAAALESAGLVATAQADGSSWRSVWREFVTDVTVGPVIIRTVNRGVAGPTDLRRRPDPDRSHFVIEIDPGDSFGSGHHPSTRQCLSAVVDLAGPGVSVLDVGTGSGILAVSAALLGAGPVLAIDIDRDAVDMAAANALANRAEVLIAAGPGDAVRGRFDLVVANLGGALAPLEMSAVLTAAVAEAGTLVIGGLLAEQASDVSRAFRPWGRVRTDLEAGWACLRIA